MNKTSVTVGAIVCLLVGFAVGYAVFNKAPQVIERTVGAISPTGSTNSATRFFSIVMSPSTIGGTSTSIINNTGFDIVVNDNRIYCAGMGSSGVYLTGAALANLTLQMATTSIGGLGLQGNTNYVGNDTLSTSSGSYYQSSSTEPVITYSGRVWPNGTYMSMTFNATNTATCAIGIAGYAL